jgi:hypothetical protein
MAKVIEAEGVPRTLAQRFGFQIAAKCDADEWGDRAVWTSIGAILCRETAWLRSRHLLSDRQIETVLPKLSAHQVDAFVEELEESDRTIARTVFNAALAQYQRIAGELTKLEPGVARTVANAAFTARSPRQKARDLLERFVQIIEGYKEVRRAIPA